MIKNILPILLISGLLVSLASAAEKEKKDLRGNYDAIEVVRFTAKDGTNFPPDYAVTLVEDMVKELQATGKFKQVLREGEKPENADAKVMRVTGTITEFNPGSRAKRYLVGFGSGKTKIVAQVKYMDVATGEQLWEDKMDGKVWIGAFGGESIGATRGLAKELAKKTKAHFFSE